MDRVLVIDDNQDTADLLSTLLEMEVGNSYKIITLYCGDLAIAEVQKEASGKIKVVITDFEMGEGPDGVDVAVEAVRRGIGHVFVNTCYPMILDTPKSKRLQEARQLPGVKVVPKMEFDAMERQVLPLLK